MRLQGKTVIVTGAGQTDCEGIGNGRATAVLFAREGANLILANRSMASLEGTLEQIRLEGFDAECHVTDVSREEDCKALIDAVAEKHGRIDVLHNNVGIAPSDGDTAKLDLDTWNSVFDVNLTGAMLLSKHVLPVMREQGNGVITHVSSTVAIMSLPIIAYKTSKMALNEFTRWLAYENAPHNIRCNVLMLGFIDTPMAIEGYHKATGKPRDELREKRDQKVPMRRQGTAWETAEVALFLASDQSSYITGAVLPMDGGLHTRQGW